MKRKLLDNGNIWQKSDGRWIGMVRYKDEFGVAQRKSFSSKKEKTLQAKMTEYVANFQEQVSNSDESRKPLKDSTTNWLQVYKFPEVERTTYDRYECTAEHQIYPYIGNKPVGDVTPADIKKLLTKHMNNGYAFTTSKKAYSLLKMHFKQMYQEGAIPNNPMAMINLTKRITTSPRRIKRASLNAIWWSCSRTGNWRKSKRKRSRNSPTANPCISSRRRIS